MNLLIAFSSPPLYPLFCNMAFIQSLFKQHSVNVTYFGLLVAIFFFPLKLKHLFIKQVFYDTFFITVFHPQVFISIFFFTDFLRYLLTSYSRRSSAGHTESINAVLEFCQENTLVVANTLFQENKTLHMDITIWSILKSD